jgi:hypothetical protein
MTVFVFTGPTLSADAARLELEATYLPPAAQGDVYRVARHRPRAIGIIDGYFEHLPAVWHKEILWAMRQGIHVFGSASMGALRAAELAAFGMVGVGWVFEQYRDGLLEDDDEVAVAHGLGETGYGPQSEALVDIRRTLAAAEAAGLVSAATRQGLEGIGKRLFYPDRSYVAILRAAAATALPTAELEALKAWLPQGRVEQKRDDALAMLRTIRGFLAGDPGPKRVLYHFEHTNVWDFARREAGELRLTGDGPDMVPIERALDELRLDPESYARARQCAVLRYLALDVADGPHPRPGSEPERPDGAGPGHALGLGNEAVRRRWLEDNGLDQTDLERLARDEARLRQVDTLAERELVVHLADHLRLSGEYPRLLARARSKQRTLAAAGWENPGLSDAGVSEAELLTWYFGQCLGQPVPAEVSAYAMRLGFPDRNAFVRALLGEYCYLRLTGPAGRASGAHRD